MTAPRQIHYCRELVLDRSQQILRSIELRFLFIYGARNQIHFLTSLSTENTFLLTQTHFFHSNLLTHSYFGLNQALILWYVFFNTLFSCIHAY